MVYLPRLCAFTLFSLLQGGFLMALVLESSAFSEGSDIPVRYSCDGADRSPPLHWTNAPANTKSFCLICDDPDAPVGTWDHWVLFNLPHDAHELAEGLVTSEKLPNGAIQGLNSWGRVGYNGPCPPRGSKHRYFFKLYALDTTLNLTSKAAKSDVEKAMKGHVLAEAKLMGRFGRS